MWFPVIAGIFREKNRCGLHHRCMAGFSGNYGRLNQSVPLKFLMDSTKGWDWNLMGIGFWCGMLVLSLIQMMLIVLKHDIFAYDIYIMAVSVVAIVFYVFMRKRSAAE